MNLQIFIGLFLFSLTAACWLHVRHEREPYDGHDFVGCIPTVIGIVAFVLLVIDLLWIVVHAATGGDTTTNWLLDFEILVGIVVLFLAADEIAARFDKRRQQPRKSYLSSLLGGS